MSERRLYKHKLTGLVTELSPEVAALFPLEEPVEPEKPAATTPKTNVPKEVAPAPKTSDDTKDGATNG